MPGKLRTTEEEQKLKMMIDENEPSQLLNWANQKALCARNASGLGCVLLLITVGKKQQHAYTF